MWKPFLEMGGRGVKVQQFKFLKEKYSVTERNAILDPISFTEIINIKICFFFLQGNEPNDNL